MSNPNELPNQIKQDLAQSDFDSRYEVLETLGQGGMGVVLKARNRALKKLVAVKVLRAAMIDDETNKKRFEVEAQAGSKLSHPNLVSVFDFGFMQADTPYLVMEYIEGTSLDKVLDEVNGGLPYLDLLDIFKQVIKGLSYIHNNGIIHRDLKNSNIMIQTIDGERYAKLLDFGIAKFLADDEGATQHLTKTGSVFGSPPYMSPEQCRGQKLDARSDIYSIGCCMYECISGMPPLLGDNASHTIFKHATERPEQLNIGTSEVETKVAQIIHRCLELSPDDRFQTAGELIAALNLVNQAPSVPQIPSLKSTEKADLDALCNRVIEQKATRDVLLPPIPKEFGRIADSTLPIIHPDGPPRMKLKSTSEHLTTGRFKTAADEVKMPRQSAVSLKVLVIVGTIIGLLPLGYLGFAAISESSTRSSIGKELAEADKAFFLGPSYFNKAKAAYKKALKQSPGNDEIAGQVSSRRGRMLFQEGKLNGAFDDFTDAIRRLRKTKEKHKEHYLDAVAGLGEIKFKQKQYDEAEKQFIEARKLAQEWNVDPEIIGNIFALSALNARYSNREKSLFFYDQALTEYQKAKTRPAERIASAYIDSALVRKKMGLNADALDRLHKAEAQCEMIVDQMQKSEIQRRIGELISTIPAGNQATKVNPVAQVDSPPQVTSAPVVNPAPVVTPAPAVVTSPPVVAPQATSPPDSQLELATMETKRYQALLEQSRQQLKYTQEQIVNAEKLGKISEERFKFVTGELGRNATSSPASP